MDEPAFLPEKKELTFKTFNTNPGPVIDLDAPTYDPSRPVVTLGLPPVGNLYKRQK
jgi:hypothetical protein